jgi:hypothetical protein
MSDQLAWINAFSVLSGAAGQFVAAWEKTRDYLAAQPGTGDTVLHQAIITGAAAPRSWPARDSPADRGVSEPRVRVCVFDRPRGRRLS